MFLCLTALAVACLSGKLLMAFTSAVILGFGPHETYEHVFLGLTPALGVAGSSCRAPSWTDIPQLLCVYLFPQKYVLTSHCIAVDACVTLLHLQNSVFLGIMLHYSNFLDLIN
jgi:hypothetical protein